MTGSPAPAPCPAVGECDLASRWVGGTVVAASDESFGEKEYLLDPGPGNWQPGRTGPGASSSTDGRPGAGGAARARTGPSSGSVCRAS